MDDTTNPTGPFVHTDELLQVHSTLDISQLSPTALDRHPFISAFLPQDQHENGSAYGRQSNSLQPGNMSADNHESDERSGEKKKKIIHRDIERQRGQEMATLYGSLRSQLPLEYLKGRRSVADQMHEAVKYIKHLEKKIKELRAKRDKLHGRSGSSHDQCDPPIKCSTTSDQDADAVVINLSGSSEVEVAINSCADQGLSLGRVLGALIGEGLIINSCNSTRVDDRLLHSIHCEIIDEEAADMTELQQRIKDSKA